MTDVVLVTADSVRYDSLDVMPTFSSFDIKLGITGGHYTRPSLSSLLSSSHEAAIRSRTVSPTLPEILNQNGYTCIGLAPSAQTDEAFGFGAGFSTYRNFVNAGNRGSRRREILSQFNTLRRIYHRLFPPHAKMSDLPTDAEVISRAVDRFNAANKPRFLWVHLMESHRPYGRGEDSIGKSLDRKALFAAERLTESERDTIKQAYRGALERVDSTIGRLLDDLDATDPVVAVTSDHGDEFGEKGYYFHQPQRCRVAQPLVEVPVAFAGADVPRERLSLLDVAPTLLDILDLPVPDPWHGYSLFDRPREQTITLAPWHNSATMLWQDFSTRLIASDADVSLKTGTERIDVEESEVPADIQDRLRDLGYVE